MRAELDARSLRYAEDDKITRLIDILKKHLKSEWKRENPGVDEKVYDDDDRKSKMFKPVTDSSNFPGVQEMVQGRC